MGDKWMTSGQSRLAARQNRAYDQRARQRAALQGPPPPRLLRPDLPTNSRQAHPLLRKPDILAAGGSYSTFACPLYRRSIVAAAPRRIREYNQLHTQQPQESQVDQVTKRPRRIRDATTRPIPVERLQPSAVGRPPGPHLQSIQAQRHAPVPASQLLSSHHGLHHTARPFLDGQAPIATRVRMEQQQQQHPYCYPNPYENHESNPFAQQVLPTYHPGTNESSIMLPNSTWNDPLDEHLVASTGAADFSFHAPHLQQSHVETGFPEPILYSPPPRHNPNKSFEVAWGESPRSGPTHFSQASRGISRFHRSQHPTSYSDSFAPFQAPQTVVLPPQHHDASRPLSPMEESYHTEGPWWQDPPAQLDRFDMPLPPFSATADHLEPPFRQVTNHQNQPPFRQVTNHQDPQPFHQVTNHQHHSGPHLASVLPSVDPMDDLGPAPQTFRQGTNHQHQSRPHLASILPSVDPISDFGPAPQTFQPEQGGIARFQKKEVLESPPPLVPARNNPASTSEEPTNLFWTSTTQSKQDTNQADAVVHTSPTVAVRENTVGPSLDSPPHETLYAQGQGDHPPVADKKSTNSKPVATFATWKRPDDSINPPRPSTTPGRLSQAPTWGQGPTSPRELARDATMVTHGDESETRVSTESGNEPIVPHRIRFFNVGVEVDMFNRPLDAQRPVVSAHPRLSQRTNSNSPDSQGLDLTEQQSLWGRS